METTPSGAVAAFELARGGEFFQPDVGDIVHVRLLGSTRLWRVRFAGAGCGAVQLLPLESDMPQIAVAEIRPILEN
jgi:hypothetical protein